MKIKCSYCDSLINDTDEVCPNCGAPNENVVRTADGVPKTIDELKRFCQSHNMPLEKMRFFIGIDYKEPRAFGIYKDENGDFVVYKNKSDGSRAVRYKGKDEAYAVNEIYQKLKAEILVRKGKKNGSNNTPPPQPPKKKKNDNYIWRILVLIIVLIVGGAILAAYLDHTPDGGYYNYNNSYYYYDPYYNDWYYYDDYYGGWSPAYDVDSQLSESYSDYYDGSYSSDYGISDFSDSEYYTDHGSGSSSGNSWDNDWDDDDWDSYDTYDSWDAGDSDWDSDW